MFLTGRKFQEYLREKHIASYLKKKPQKPRNFLLLDCFLRFENNAEKTLTRKTLSQIVCPKSFRQIHCDLYQTLIQFLRTGSINSNSDNLCVWLDSNQVAVVGQTEIGKTEFAKKIFNEVKNDFQYPFYISLKGVDCEKELNLLEFLTSNLSYFPWIEGYNCKNRSDKTSVTFETHVECICKGNVLIVFDEIALSNFSHDCFNSRILHNIHFRKTKIKYFISNILTQELLPKAKTVIVLNPWEYNALKLNNENLPPSNPINILGIDHEFSAMSIKLFCTTHCKHSNTEKLNEQNRPAIKNQNEKNCVICENPHLQDEIKSLFYVPCHYNDLMDIYGNCLNFCGIAKLLLTWLNKIIKKYEDKNCSWENVGNFAWRQYIHGNYTFALQNSQDCSLSKIEKNLFFISLKKKSAFDDVSYCFIHMLLQEFLSGLWWLNVSEIYLNQHKHEFANCQRADLVLNFMKAICHSSKSQQLADIKFWKVKEENYTKLLNECKNANDSRHFTPRPAKLSGYLRKLKKKLV